MIDVVHNVCKLCKPLGAFGEAEIHVANVRSQCFFRQFRAVATPAGGSRANDGTWHPAIMMG
jgi:hypothetical protein